MNPQTKMLAWNRSMLRAIRECSPAARRWIERKVNENLATISELEVDHVDLTKS